MIFYRTLQPVQALSFDLDDTLYDNHPLIMQAERQLLAYLAEHFPQTSKLSSDDWRRVKFQHLSQRPELMSDMGELRKLTLRSGLQRSGLVNTQLDDAVNASFEYFYFQRSNFKVDKNICSLLDKLSQQVPLIAITNGNVNLQQIGIASYFSHCFKASINQPMKPHSKMFSLAAEAVDLPAKQILHVGDNLDKDVRGAVAAGMQSAWFAYNRKMHLNQERTTVLPHVQLTHLTDLQQLISWGQSC